MNETLKQLLDTVERIQEDQRSLSQIIETLATKVNIGVI